MVSRLWPIVPILRRQRPFATTISHSQNGAGNGTRTRDPKLGRLALYQLSYSRNTKMVEREGFEPSKALPADLQSAPFGHSGTSPCLSTPYKATTMQVPNPLKISQKTRNVGWSWR